MRAAAVAPRVSLESSDASPDARTLAELLIDRKQDRVLRAAFIEHAPPGSIVTVSP